MGKTRKLFLIFLTSMVLMIFLLYYEVFIRNTMYIRVNYIASYKINEEMDHIEYYGDYSVGDVKKMMEEEEWKRRFGDLEGLRKKLDKLDDNTEIAISLGSGIQYFWLPKHHHEEYDGYFNVQYESKRPKNKIYFYTSDFKWLVYE